MQVSKTFVALVSMMVLGGCANLANQQVSSRPSEAVPAFAAAYDKQSTTDVVGIYTDITLDGTAAIKTLNEARSYCLKRKGQVEPWPGQNQSFNCVGPDGKVQFALQLHYGMQESTRLQLLERTPENDSFYDLQLSSMGYRSEAQIAAEQQRLRAANLEVQRKTQERLIQERLRNRDQVAFVGAQVCQVTDHWGQPVILVGTVEQVADDRLKIFVERATFPGAPGLSPGGFRQQYTWSNLWDWEACRYE